MDADYFKQTFHFAQEGSAPLYAQLASYLKIQIQAGVYKPGDQMLTEAVLCEILNVSRTTVRLSMNRLLEEGLIVRYRGKGSFIAEPKLRRNINYMYDFTENIRDLGAVPGSVVLNSVVKTPSETVREKLMLPDGAKVFRLSRLRCANGIPLLLETSYIPCYLCPGIESVDFAVNSLYNVLSSRYSLNLHRAEETIEAVLIDRETAKQLQVEKKMPGYRIERISYLGSGHVFEYTKSITRADKCVFKLDLMRNDASGRHVVDFERRLTTV